MLRPQLLAPLASSSAQCSLHAILSLPPELRSIAARSFATTAFVAATSYSGNHGENTSSASVSLDLSPLGANENESGVRLSARTQRRQHVAVHRASGDSSRPARPRARSNPRISTQGGIRRVLNDSGNGTGGSAVAIRRTNLRPIPQSTILAKNQARKADTGRRSAQRLAIINHASVPFQHQFDAELGFGAIAKGVVTKSKMRSSTERDYKASAEEFDLDERFKDLVITGKKSHKLNLFRSGRPNIALKKFLQRLRNQRNTPGRQEFVLDNVRKGLEDQAQQAEYIKVPSGSVFTLKEFEDSERLAEEMLKSGWLRAYRSGRDSKSELLDPFLQKYHQRCDIAERAKCRGALLRKYTRKRTLADDATSVSQRLATLKKTLLESPKAMANAAVIQRQLRELESLYKRSLKANLLDVSAELETQITPADPEKEVIAPSKMLELSPTDQNLLSQSPVISLFTDLKEQIQALTDLLKVMMTRNASSYDTISAPPLALPQNSSHGKHVIEAVEADSTGSNASTAAPAEQSEAQGDPFEPRVSGRSQAFDDARAAAAAAFSTLPHEIGNEDENPPSVDNIKARDPLKTSPSPSTSIQVDEEIKAPSVKRYSRHSAPKDAETADGSKSLYEQLFPETASSPKIEADTRAVPLLAMPSDIVNTSLQEPIKVKARTKSEQLEQIYDEKQNRSKIVLLLRGVSKSLTEDDFRRAVPGGKHLQQWAGRGSFEKVIPMRDPWTLETTGNYFIVFGSSQSADAFSAHVKRLLSLATRHTPTSLMSNLHSLARGSRNGSDEDEAEMVKNFSLLVPSMSLDLKRVPNATKLDVLKHGGYPQALSGNLTQQTPQVILEMYGGNMPNWFQIRDAIIKDGTRRGLPWDIFPGDLGIRKLAMRRPTHDLVRSSLDNAGFGDTADSTVDPATLDAQDRLQSNVHGQRWLVAFKVREDAQRFARTWHMRAFPWAREDRTRADAFQRVTKVKAEMLW